MEATFPLDWTSWGFQAHFYTRGVQWHPLGIDHQLVKIAGESPSSFFLSQSESHSFTSTPPGPTPVVLCGFPHPSLLARWWPLCMWPVFNRPPIHLDQKAEYSLHFLKFKLDCVWLPRRTLCSLFLVLPSDTHGGRMPCKGHSLILPSCILLVPPPPPFAVHYSLTPGLWLLFALFSTSPSVNSLFHFPLVLSLKFSWLLFSVLSTQSRAAIGHLHIPAPGPPQPAVGHHNLAPHPLEQFCLLTLFFTTSSLNQSKL